MEGRTSFRQTSVYINFRRAFLFVVALWIVSIIDFLVFAGGLGANGIHPRSLDGLWGILWAPMLHGSFRHLFMNTSGVFVCLWLALQSDGRRMPVALVIIWAGAGLGTWLIGGADTNHIGASLLVYGLIGYLIGNGLFRRSFPAILTATLVGFFYWGAIEQLLNIGQERISWEGHLSGFQSGLLAAWWLRNPA